MLRSAPQRAALGRALTETADVPQTSKNAFRALDFQPMLLGVGSRLTPPRPLPRVPTGLSATPTLRISLPSPLQEDRELVAKLRPLARFSTPQDHEELIENLLLAKKMRCVLAVLCPCVCERVLLSLALSLPRSPQDLVFFFSVSTCRSVSLLLLSRVIVWGFQPSWMATRARLFPPGVAKFADSVDLRLFHLILLFIIPSPPLARSG